MSNIEATPIFANLEADYLDVGTADIPDIQLMKVFETIDENPNAQTVEKYYTANKSATTITTGYQTQFPITMDKYKNDAVSEFIRDIAEEQKLGIQCDHIKVRLYQPITAKENTFYARKFRVGFAIDSISKQGGQIISVEGNMNAMSDAEIGEFNVESRTFTAPGADAPIT